MTIAMTKQFECSKTADGPLDETSNVPVDIALIYGQSNKISIGK